MISVERSRFVSEIASIQSLIETTGAGTVVLFVVGCALY